MRIILHLDMDAFFASVEERDKPWLKGKPIVVGADPKDGGGRGVVSTANYAARKYGIHSALPISTAWRLSEQARSEGKSPAVFLAGTYHKYSETSARIMDIMRRYVDKLEPASIDEAYADVSSAGSYAKAKTIAGKIKKEIAAKEKLTCSVGIAPNKLISKIAAGSHKPNGLTVITEVEAQKFLDPLPAKEIPGIGPKSAAMLEQRGIRTIAELRGVGAEKLTDWFGKWGSEMNEKANGRDDSPVVEGYETKSIGEQETFEVDTRDATLLLGRLRAMCLAVATRATREGFQWKTVSITVRFGDFKTVSRAYTMKRYASNAKTLELEAVRLFLPFLDARENPKKKLIRLLGVRVEHLVVSPQDLFHRNSL
ncbi:MAG: DNA polymerase IV [bacterium]|nr:DNA polymerase IV [bacterium]